MHAPAHVCRSVYRLHKNLRLAWAGRQPKTADELNPGDFAIVQLYHVLDAGSPDFPKTYRSFWDTEDKLNIHGELSPIKIDRGPVFNRKGGLTRDWDTTTRTPIFVALLNESFDTSREEVLSGQIIYKLEGWLGPLKERIYNRAKAMGKDLASMAREKSLEAGDFLWYQANLPNATKPVVPREQWKHDLAKAETDLAKTRRDLENYYMPPGMSV